MSKGHSTFLEYRIYRKKFLGTIIVVIVLCLSAFSGVLFFFIRNWVNDVQIQSQYRFQQKERQLENVQTWTRSYVEGLYTDAALMEDLKALFGAVNNQDYIAKRRENSLNSDSEIRYVPADVKKLFLDGRTKICGVTLRSDNGIKALRMTNYDLWVDFECRTIEDVKTIPGFGDIMASSYSVRDPDTMSISMGTMDFWISAADFYEVNDEINASWGIFDADGDMLANSKMSPQQEAELFQAALRGVQFGWLENTGSRRTFFTKHTSNQGTFSYVVIKSIGELVADNRYVVGVIGTTLFLIAFGIILFTNMQLKADYEFLSKIIHMLSHMESGEFADVQEEDLSSERRKNEYGMIAVALKDVGTKLQGHIQREYVWKLKEQETQMRALQHQINPHFLYNTLETLRSRALLEGDRDTADAIALLGALYRARTHTKDTITLGEEFKLLEMYLKIMELRFGDNFFYQVKLEDALREIPTVSFWLQPLAENFFTHGFDRESMYNLLIISGHAQGPDAVIEIMDNGSGVPADQLEQVQKTMREGNDDPEADIGLRNVYMRLNYFYGNGFKMEIGNNPEGGFKISILIPGKVEEDVHIGDRG